MSSRSIREEIVKSLPVTTKHNITVAIEPGLLKKARAVAAKRGRSVSSLLADELRELVADDAGYALARKRAIALFATPLSLGGKPLNREALHERTRLR
jgi:hypothetical protein